MEVVTMAVVALAAAASAAAALAAEDSVAAVLEEVDTMVVVAAAAVVARSWEHTRLALPTWSRRCNPSVVGSVASVAESTEVD